MDPSSYGTIKQFSTNTYNDLNREIDEKIQNIRKKYTEFASDLYNKNNRHKLLRDSDSFAYNNGHARN